MNNKEIYFACINIAKDLYAAPTAEDIKRNADILYEAVLNRDKEEVEPETEAKVCDQPSVLEFFNAEKAREYAEEGKDSRYEMQFEEYLRQIKDSVRFGNDSEYLVAKKRQLWQIDVLNDICTLLTKLGYEIDEGQASSSFVEYKVSW